MNLQKSQYAYLVIKKHVLLFTVFCGYFDKKVQNYKELHFFI